MKYAEFLKPGGTIGFIAPSFGCATEPYISRFNNARIKFQEMGYRCVEGPNCRISSGIGKSNTPEKCGKEINDFFLNDKCDVIISCGGGETMCEDLPYIDYNSIADNPPKWFMGYSDNTNLVFTLPVLCDTAAIYGPCVSEFGQKNWHQSVNDAFNTLTGKSIVSHGFDKWEKDPFDAKSDPLCGFNCTERSSLKIMGSARGQSSVKFSGRLIGGCLDILTLLCGTKYDKVNEFCSKYKNDRIIWFIESCDLTSVAVRRSLWSLKESGWFDNASGFIIGRPYLYDDESFGLTQTQAVVEILDDLSLPIILNADIGHLSPMMPVIAGAYAEVSVFQDSINLKHYLI